MKKKINRTLKRQKTTREVSQPIVNVLCGKFLKVYVKAICLVVIEF